MGKKTKTGTIAAPEAEAVPAPAPEREATSGPGGGPTSGMDGNISALASAGAPFLYFENASVSGHLNGVIRVTLEASRIMPGDQGRVFTDRVLVGHLRMNIPAAQSLRAALDRALLMASPAATETRN